LYLNSIPYVGGQLTGRGRYPPRLLGSPLRSRASIARRCFAEQRSVPTNQPIIDRDRAIERQQDSEAARGGWLLLSASWRSDFTSGRTRKVHVECCDVAGSRSTFGDLVVGLGRRSTSANNRMRSRSRRVRKMPGAALGFTNGSIDCACADRGSRSGLSERCDRQTDQRRGTNIEVGRFKSLLTIEVEIEPGLSSVESTFRDASTLRRPRGERSRPPVLFRARAQARHLA
jgi:hypothetical protein